MKIKSDFVTNSSSTMYIVFLPKDYYPNERIMMQCSKDHILYEGEFLPFIKDYHGPELSIEEQIELEKYLCTEIPDHIDALRKHGELWTYGGDGTNPFIFWTLVDCFEKESLQLQVLDVNGEGNNRIIAITAENLKDHFATEMLKEMKVKGIEKC